MTIALFNWFKQQKFEIAFVFPALREQFHHIKNYSFFCCFRWIWLWKYQPCFSAVFGPPSQQWKYFIRGKHYFTFLSNMILDFLNIIHGLIQYSQYLKVFSDVLFSPFSKPRPNFTLRLSFIIVLKLSSYW